MMDLTLGERLFYLLFFLLGLLAIFLFLGLNKTSFVTLKFKDCETLSHSILKVHGSFQFYYFSGSFCGF